jgi:hypothetical protein
MKTLRLFIALFLFLTACAIPPMPEPTMTPDPSATASPSPTPAPRLGAGFRFSTYGPPRNPGPAYWASVGEQMAAKFPGAQPEAIWIVGNFLGGGMTHLSFNAQNSGDPAIKSGAVDMNEAALALFDQKGVKVWLQVEPANAEMLTLIDLVMNQYKHHPCVIGFGVDVEWHKSDGSPEGTPVSDAEAEQWVKAIRAHGAQYRLFLKHWDPNWLPPTYREGLVFVNDSQQFESFDQLVADFSAWGQHFSPAPVAFQYGYPDDRKWWGNLADPPGEIGKAILANVPNTSALFWVDFTVFEVFPPQ